MSTAIDGVTYTPSELDRDATFYVAGHRGLVGSAIVRKLEAEGFTHVVGKTSAELDLKSRDDVFAYMADIKPRYLVLAAAKVGGILANSTYPVDFLSDNMRIQTNVLDAALASDVERVAFLGSSCIYPKLAEQPIREDSLLTGHLEPTNDAYAIAKIAGILHTQAVRRQYGLPWISAMPTNLYGPNDNFSPKGSHVLPALIRRYDEAAKAGAPAVTNWGTGTPRREFLHSDDMADAVLHLMEHYDGPDQVNVGTGSDVTIARDRGDDRRRDRVRRRHRMGHHQARRHPAEAARRLQARPGRLDRQDQSARGTRAHGRVVPRPRRLHSRVSPWCTATSCSSVSTTMSTSTMWRTPSGS
ncbi:GDP-L-fucose synthase [Microbacterium sp. SORGH_AS 505]|nr:GDP-L-fucose synthase [Microbacterium sp. SORGH_AS_0505]